MRVIILAGGLGTRLAEETVVRPKPMVEIGGKPILWHIMSIYSAAGFNEFVIALGYKGEVIKEYFLNFRALTNNITVDVRLGKMIVHEIARTDWIVHLVDTGMATQTGGRIKRLRESAGGSTFMASYGDGLGNIDLRGLLKFHRSHGRIATVTAVRLPSRFGEVVSDGDTVTRFSEKPRTGEGWISGGFFVFEPKVFDYIAGDETPLEREPMEMLVKDRQLMMYRHSGFWQPMDTLREKHILEELWASGRAPWKVWE